MHALRAITTINKKGEETRKRYKKWIIEQEIFVAIRYIFVHVAILIIPMMYIF